MAEAVKAEETAEEQKPVELSADEKKAESKGWAPLDKWVDKGNAEEDHISAQMYLVRGQFLDDQRRDRKEIAELSAKVDNVGKMMVDEKKASYERGIQEAEAKHAKALDDGDNAAATAALDDIKNLDKEVMTPGPDPFDTWVQGNDWYRNDPVLFTYANEMDKFVHMQAGGRAMGAGEIGPHMDKVRELVKDRYPEKFGNPARDEQRTSEKTTGRTVATKTTEVKLEDLPDEMQTRAKQFVENELGSVKDYIQVLIDSGDIRVEG